MPKEVAKAIGDKSPWRPVAMARQAKVTLTTLKAGKM
jgi:hypothetical protein